MSHFSDTDLIKLVEQTQEFLREALPNKDKWADHYVYDDFIPGVGPVIVQPGLNIQKVVGGPELPFIPSRSIKFDRNDAVETVAELLEYSSKSLVVYYQPYNSAPGNGGGSSKLPPSGMPIKWAREFVIRFLAELRKQICSSKKNLEKRGGATEVTPQALASALAAWFAKVAEVPGPLAIGLGTLVILVVSQCGTDAFCSMTDGELEDLVRNPPRK